MHWCVYDEQHWEHTEFIYEVIQHKADLWVVLLKDMVNLKANMGSREVQEGEMHCDLWLTKQVKPTSTSASPKS